MVLVAFILESGFQPRWHVRDELVWKRGCPEELNPERPPSPSALRGIRFSWPWKTIRASSAAQASWTQSAAFEESFVPKKLSLKFSHLLGSPGKLGTAPLPAEPPARMSLPCVAFGGT